MDQIQNKIKELQVKIQQENAKRNQIIQQQPPIDVDQRIQMAYNKANELQSRMHTLRQKKNELQMNFTRYKNDYDNCKNYCEELQKEIKTLRESKSKNIKLKKEKDEIEKV